MPGSRTGATSRSRPRRYSSSSSRRLRRGADGRRRGGAARAPRCATTRGMRRTGRGVAGSAARWPRGSATGGPTPRPGVLVDVPDAGVVAEERGQRAVLRPAHAELGVRVAHEAADIVKADEGLTGQAQPARHRHRETEVVPSGEVVAHPVRGVPLDAGEACPRQHEGTAVRPRSLKAFGRAHRHQQRVRFGKTARFDRFDGYRDRAQVALDGVDLDLTEDSEAGVYQRLLDGKLDVIWDIPYPRPRSSWPIR